MFILCKSELFDLEFLRDEGLVYDTDDDFAEMIRKNRTTEIESRKNSDEIHCYQRSLPVRKIATSLRIFSVTVFKILRIF